MSIQYEAPLADSYGVADSFPKDFGYGEEEGDIEDSPDGIKEEWKVIYPKGKRKIFYLDSVTYVLSPC